MAEESEYGLGKRDQVGVSDGDALRVAGAASSEHVHDAHRCSVLGCLVSAGHGSGREQTASLRDGVLARIFYRMGEGSDLANKPI